MDVHQKMSRKLFYTLVDVTYKVTWRVNINLKWRVMIGRKRRRSNIVLSILREKYIKTIIESKQHWQAGFERFWLVCWGLARELYTIQLEQFCEKLMESHCFLLVLFLLAGGKCVQCLVCVCCFLTNTILWHKILTEQTFLSLTH